MTASDVANARVWVIDDTDDMRKLYATILRRAGYEVSCFARPEKALAAFQQSPPDVAIVDYMMPGCTGAELIRRTRAALGSAAPPMLVVTAATMGQYVQDSLDAGARDFLKKPVPARILLAKVKREVDNARAAAEAANEQARARFLEKEVQQAVELEAPSLPRAPLQLGPWRCWVSWDRIGRRLPPVTIAEHLCGERSVVVVFCSDATGATGAMRSAALRGRLRSLIKSRSLPIAIHQIGSELRQDASLPNLYLLGLEGFGEHVLSARTLNTTLLVTDGDRRTFAGDPTHPKARGAFEFDCFRRGVGQRCALWTGDFGGQYSLLSGTQPCVDGGNSDVTADSLVELSVTLEKTA